MFTSNMLMSHGSVGNFLSASDTRYTTSTTQDQVVPALAPEGSLILAHVMHRSALTPPSGWTLVDSVEFETSSTKQWQSVYQRTALAGEGNTSYTWTQASSGRMSVHYQVYSSVFSVKNQATVFTSDTGTNIRSYASLASQNLDDIFVMSGSFVLAAISSTITSTPGTQTTATTMDDNRMGAAYLHATHPETLSGEFETSSGDTGNGSGAVTVLIGK